MKWVSDGRGLSFREHATRKHGVRPDRYYRGRYKIDGKAKAVSFGWESENRKPGRESFRDSCMQELFILKSNARDGQGATTLKEKRAMAEQKRNDKAVEKITFGDFFTDTYWPVSSSSKKKSSYEKEIQHFKIWIEPVVGAIPFKTISQIHVEKIKRKLQRAGRSPRTIEYVLSTFRQVWNLAKSTGIVMVDSPSKKVKIHRPDNERKRYLTDDECEALLDELESRNTQVYQMALVSLDSGARFSEVARLKWSHLNIDDGVITFSDTKKAGGTKSRVVPMTSRLRDLFKSMPMGGKSKLLFPGKDGGVLREVSSTFRTGVTAQGLNEGISDPRMTVCFHSLRHTNASRLIQAGVDLYTVQRLLGHSVSKMTERYAHLSNDTLRAAVERMEQATAEKTTADVIQLKVNGKE
jgi:integrase